MLLDLMDSALMVMGVPWSALTPLYHSYNPINNKPQFVAVDTCGAEVSLHRLIDSHNGLHASLFLPMRSLAGSKGKKLIWLKEPTRNGLNKDIGRHQGINETVFIRPWLSKLFENRASLRFTKLTQMPLKR